MFHTNLAGVYIVAEKLRKSIEKIKTTVVGPYTASFGVAELQKDESYDDLYKRIDLALYEAKKLGKNRVVRSITDEGISKDKDLEWQDTWNSGEEKIDFQHRELCDMLNKKKYRKLNLNDKKLILSKIDLIIKRMEEIEFDELLDHKKIHKDLIYIVYSLKEKFIRGDIKLEILLEIIFHDLILGHHLIEDTKFFLDLRVKTF